MAVAPMRDAAPYPSDRGYTLRNLKPAAVLGLRKPHGTRIRYLAGCRCLKCRMANANYSRTRAHAVLAGDYRGIVSADKARKHLRKLTAAGVGCREVARRTGVRRTTVGAIYRGAKLRIRGNTERKILSVSCLDAAGGALVDAGTTWKLINDLIAEGFTRTRIARELGSKAKQPALQIRRTRCRARQARQVRALWRKYMTAAGE